ncbi:hypothetical protein BC830DRAFT_1092051 [Chytriomyces sp. MP71]|nr:hypothetical protein BC830DRAFT_1092051 [Chytriomyces sp. MP71]
MPPCCRVMCILDMQYFACTANPMKLVQNWLNLVMTSSQSIQAYWTQATRLLKDLQPISNNPNVAPHVTFAAIWLLIIDGLYKLVFSTSKSALKVDGNKTDESKLLAHLIELDEEVRWKPTDVALASQSNMNQGNLSPPRIQISNRTTTIADMMKVAGMVVIVKVLLTEAKPIAASCMMGNQQHEFVI